MRSMFGADAGCLAINYQPLFSVRFVDCSGVTVNGNQDRNVSIQLSWTGTRTLCKAICFCPSAQFQWTSNRFRLIRKGNDSWDISAGAVPTPERGGNNLPGVTDIHLILLKRLQDTAASDIRCRANLTCTAPRILKKGIWCASCGSVGHDASFVWELT